MWFIVFGMVFSIGGLLAMSGAGRTSQYIDNSRPVLLYFGATLEVMAVFLFIIGIKEYFLAEIITELKKLNAPKS